MHAATDLSHTFRILFTQDYYKGSQTSRHALLWIQSCNESFDIAWTKNNPREKQYNMYENYDNYLLLNPRIEIFKKILPLPSLPLARNNAGNIRFQHNRVTFRWGLIEEVRNELHADINQRHYIEDRGQVRVERLW